MLQVDANFYWNYSMNKLFIRYCFFSLLGIVPLAHSQNATSVFTSGGQSIHVDEYLASGSGLHPSVVYMYGEDGMTLFPSAYQMLGDAFARSGYDFYIVHYFDRTGSTFMQLLSNPVLMYTNMAAWEQTLNDAITFVSMQPGVDASHVGVMSLSLGSFVAISEVATDARVKALVEWSGYPLNLPLPKTFPPTFIVNGGEDTIVPMTEVNAFVSALESAGVPYQEQIYPSDGHVLSTSDWISAAGKSIQFFGSHL
jgi:dienelactone hydrolase